MASRFRRFTSFTRAVFGTRPPVNLSDPSRGSLGKQFVELEARCVPATFIVTNILDNQSDVVGGLSLRQAINAANSNPGFDRIEFNIPRSASLPTLPNDPTENYFPIVLASTLPVLNDSAGVAIDASTQPRNNEASTRPIIQLLPDPNPAAFPSNSVGAFSIKSSNNVFRGFVMTGFPGAAINFSSPNAFNNTVVGNWINTDISGLKPWSEDPIILQARPPGTPAELTNTGPNPNLNPLFVLAGITLSNGANRNTIGGMVDVGGVPLIDAGGKFTGTGGTLFRYNKAGVLVDTKIAITPEINRNIISGTPEFRKDYYDYVFGGQIKTRLREISGAGVGAGIRIMDPNTSNNLIQGNFIGTDVSGNKAIPNHNGIEIFNSATSNYIGNPNTNFVGDPVASGFGNLIRFNENDGVRVASTPNPSQFNPPPPSPGNPEQPYDEGLDNKTVTGPQAPFGPGGTVFYDAFNPNYFVGISSAGGQIFNVGRTDPATGITSAGISAQPGTEITLRGSGLLSTSSVTFTSAIAGQTVPAPFRIVDDVEVRVTVPVGSATGPLRLFSPAGVATLAQAVILPSAPTQIEIVSTSSPSGGTAGTKVTIFGTNFTGAQSISFGGVLATDFIVGPNGTSVDVIVPTGAQSGPITIVAPGGAATTSRPFAVIQQPPPIITNVSASAGLPGQEITLTGVNFTGAYLVRFNFSAGGGGIATTNITFDSPTQIRVRVPAQATAINPARPIQVVTNDGFGVSTSTFQILTPAAPSVTGISSSTGPIGTILTITGTNFSSATRVTIGGVDATTYTIVSGTTITATVPAGLPLNPGAVVRVQSAGGTGTGSQTFTPVASSAPTVDPIPLAIRNNFAIINGTNLLGTTKVLFGNATTGTPAPFFEVVSQTQVRVQIPPAVANSGTFFLFTAFNTQQPLQPPAQNTFNVSPSFAPIIGVARLSNPISGVVGSIVSLRGQGFLATQEVLFPSTLGAGTTVPATDLTVVSDFEITFRVPRFATTGPITVISPGSPDPDVPFPPPATPPAVTDKTEVTTTPFSYTVLPSPVPEIDFVSPRSGTVGSLVSIIGRGFTGTVQVTIGGAVAEDFTIFSDTSIIVRVPLLAADGTITVLSPDNATVTSAAPFDVVRGGLPTITFSSPRAARNTQVTIAGTNLASTTSVQFNDIVAQFKVISDSLITAIVPISAGPGELRLTTVEGTTASPTPFNLEFVPPPRLNAGTEETADIGPIGTKVFVNGSGLGGVFRVELINSVTKAVTAARFDPPSAGQILITVPEVDVGVYDIVVYSSTLNGNDPGNTGLGTNSATGFTVATNILGTAFTYGERFTVTANARPSVSKIESVDTNKLGIPVPYERGVPIRITGTGFTGANRITIGAATINNPALFTVVDDTQITTNLPIAALAGIGPLANQLVTVFTPNGIVGFIGDDLPSLEAEVANKLTIAATTPLQFTVGAGAFYGSTVTITATAGNFYGIVQLLADAKDNSVPIGARIDLGTNLPSPQVAPITAPTPFQNFTITPGKAGMEIRAVIPTGFAKIPVPVDNSPVPPMGTPNPVPAAIANIEFHAVNGVGTDIRATNKITVAKAPDPNANSIASLVGGQYNNLYRITGGKGLIATSDITIGGAPLGDYGVDRNNIEVTILGPNTVQLTFQIRTIRSPLIPIQTINWPTGDLEVNNAEGKSSISFPLRAQTVPSLLTLTARVAPPQDNRVLANRIFGNGVTINRDAAGRFVDTTPKTQAQLFEDGNLAIDFVTAMPAALAKLPPFDYGYAHTQQGPQTGPPPGNQGRGGLNDGFLNSFSLQSGFSVLPGQPGFPLIDPGKNSFNNTQFGRYFGPNLLQNFPLLQEVQSTADRTTFSTALIAKPFRTYRIDYYYSPGVDNLVSAADLDPFLSSRPNFVDATRFDDEDVTARKTTNVGNGQIYLGSKFVTTDRQGDASVSFDIFRRLPNAQGVVPDSLPGDFFLPGNVPLFPSEIDPVTGAITNKAGVVTTTATDLTAPSPQGPILTTGPDGTSRFSFFKRVDTPTGSINGRVIIDKNTNGVIDSDEVGVIGAQVQLFVLRPDLTYSPAPVSIQPITADGNFSFDPDNTGGYGIANGKQKLVLILPQGGPVTFFFETPEDGVRFPTIINGEKVSGQNFLVTDRPFVPNTPPTISAIGNQSVASGATVGPLSFTIGDAQTPAAELRVAVLSTNSSVVNPAQIVIAGSGASRTIRVPTVAGSNGSSTVTITVTDLEGLTSNESFVINSGVPGANSAPIISDIGNVDTQPGTSFTRSFTVSDAETPAGNLSITVTSSNLSVVPANAFTLGGSGSDRTISFILPNSKITGTSTIRVTVTDDGGLSSTDTFRVTVPPAPGTAPALLAIGSDAGRPGTVNVYNPNGEFRYSFQPYGGGFTGGVRVATGDVNGDGNADVITAPGIGIGGLVKIYDGISGDFLAQYLPYGDTFKGGVYVVTGDVDGDGIKDIITGTGKGGGPRVRVVQGGANLALATIADFFPYESTFRGGVLVAAGNVNGDRFADIITGTGIGGGPRVRVLDGTRLSSTPGEGTLYDFFAYESTFRGGVFASVGDVDGDGISEILTGTGFGGGPVVKVFKQSDLRGAGAQPSASKSFFAYDPGFRGGVRIDALDANGDGIVDIITAPGAGLPPEVRLIDFVTLQDIYRITSFESGFNGGVFVGGTV